MFNEKTGRKTVIGAARICRPIEGAGSARSGGAEWW